MVATMSSRESVPLRPTDEDCSITDAFFETDIGLDFRFSDNGCGKSTRSALNSLCALSMKPFIVDVDKPKRSAGAFES